MRRRGAGSLADTILTAAGREKLWRDPALQTYYGEEMLDNQAPWMVPDDWQEQYDKWMAEDVRRAFFELHADFLESLFDKNGYATLYRALDTRRMKRPPEPGDVANIGRYWTYSANAILEDAQMSSSSIFDTIFAGRVHISQVHWKDTLPDHMFRHWHEKQIFVDGPVEILDVFPIGQFRKKAPTINFDRWAKRQVRA